MRFFTFFILFVGGLFALSCALPSAPAEDSLQVHPGVQHFVDNAMDYSVSIGVGEDQYPITSAYLEGDTLYFAYPAYNNGREKGHIDSKGTFVGTFTTDVSAGTVRIEFNEDGTATGAWLLNQKWLDFYGTDKTVLGMGYGPNNINR